MWVLLAIRDGAVEVAKFSSDYDDIGYAAGMLVRNVLGEAAWFDFVQGDRMPNFAAGEWFSQDGLRIGVVQAEECVFI